MFQKILGVLGGETIKNTAQVIGDTIDRFVETDDEIRESQQLTEKIKFMGRKMQAEITLAAQKHSSKFVSWARPFLMWVCGVSLAFLFLGTIFFNMVIASMVLINTNDYQLAQTTFLNGTKWVGDITLELVLAMLGLGVLRTAEKFGGVARN